MAIKSSGPISFQDIIDEFGGTGQAGLSEYYRGGSLVPNTNANINIGVQGDPIALSQFYGARKEIFFTFTFQASGGAGGNGLANGNGSGTNTPGNRTGIMTKAKYDALIAAGTTNPAASDFLDYIEGGAGGGHGNAGAITGRSGGTTVFGAGGAGGTPNQAAPLPTWTHWGAGGGGGGGDDGSTSYFNLYGSDAAGNAGSGGGAGTAATGQTSIDTETDYVVWIGGGGAPASVYNYRGAPGVPAHVEFNLSTDPTVKYFAIPSGDGSNAAHYTRNSYWNLRLLSSGQVLFSRVEDDTPAIVAQPINGSWGTTGANEVDNFNTVQIGWRLNTDGSTSKIVSGLSGGLFSYPQTTQDWIPESQQVAGIGSNYEVQLNATSGTPTYLQGGNNAAFDVWLPLTSSISCYLELDGQGFEQARLRLRIRNATTLNVDVDQTVNIDLSTIPGG